MPKIFSTHFLEAVRQTADRLNKSTIKGAQESLIGLEHKISKEDGSRKKIL